MSVWEMVRPIRSDGRRRQAWVIAGVGAVILVVMGVIGVVAGKAGGHLRYGHPVSCIAGRRPARGAPPEEA